MSSKTKKVIKAVKATAKNAADKAKTTAKRSLKKVQTAAKKVVAKAKTSAKTTAKKVSAKAKTQGKKPVGFMQNVKDSIHTGMEAMGELIKKITPDALLPDSAKSKGSAKATGK